MVNSPWNRIGGLRSVRSRFESRGVVVLLLGEREFEGLLHLFFAFPPTHILSDIVPVSALIWLAARVFVCSMSHSSVGKV